MIYIIDHYHFGLSSLVYFDTWDEAEAWRVVHAPRHYIVALERVVAS